MDEPFHFYDFNNGQLTTYNRQIVLTI